MALNDAGLVLAGNAVEAAITHMQLHSGARGAAGDQNLVGSRFAVTGVVSAGGDITWADQAVTGLPASTTVAEVSYHSAATGGTCYGGAARTSGDATTNAAGEYTVNASENFTGS